MHQYGESKTTRIMMAIAPHVPSSLGLRKFQADRFLFDRVYKTLWSISVTIHLYQAPATYGTRAKRGMWNNFQWHT